MLDLAGLTPIDIQHARESVRLTWEPTGNKIETDTDRFRPTELQAEPGRRALDVTWTDFGDLPMTDQFFNITIDRAKELASAAAPFHTNANTLAAVGRLPGRLPFAGVVFHMARTGSTLIHRLFSRTGQVHSLSEVTLFDQAANIAASWPDEPRNAMLRDLYGTYQRPRRPNERYFITKMTDAAASIRLPVFRAAFPEVPWIFVYRDPVEVMVSALKRRTGNIELWHDNRTKSSERLQMPELNDPGMSTDEFIARTLGRFCENAVREAKTTAPGKFLAVSYSRLPDAVWETIAPHFGIELTDEDLIRMRDEAKYSAKRSDLTEFRPDGERKQKDATESTILLAKRFVEPLMEELKTLPQG